MASSENSQSISRFVLAFAYPKYKSFFHFHDIFSDLSMEKVLAIHQSGFDASVSFNRGSTVHSGTLRAPKMMTYRPTRCQVLISPNAPTTEVIVVNAATVVESVCKAWDGISISTNFVTSVAELEVIKQ